MLSLLFSHVASPDPGSAMAGGCRGLRERLPARSAHQLHVSNLEHSAPCPLSLTCPILIRDSQDGSEAWLPLTVSSLMEQVLTTMSVSIFSPLPHNLHAPEWTILQTVPPLHLLTTTKARGQPPSGHHFHLGYLCPSSPIPITGV